MPKKVIRCSMPGCLEVAVSKVAGHWQYGPHAELKTYGYACSTHVDSVVAYAHKRPNAGPLAPDESVGEISNFPLHEL